MPRWGTCVGDLLGEMPVKNREEKRAVAENSQTTKQI